MITDEELSQLPDDPEEAFIAYERILAKKLDDFGNGWDTERRYVDALFAFEAVHQTSFLRSVERPPISNEDFPDYYKWFRSVVDSSILRFRLERAKSQRSGIITVLQLDASHRKTIHFHIANIRETLDKVELTEAKRESLFKKLNAFAEEVDRNRTKLDAMVSFALEVSAAAGKSAENLKPVRDLLDPLWKWLGKAKEETQALPAPKESPRLDAPKKQLPKPQHNYDDVPF